MARSVSSSSLPLVDTTSISVEDREWFLIDSTIREGLQFCNAFFSSSEKREIAQRISDFGIEYIELLNPCVSEQSFLDIKAIVEMGLSSKILTHVRGDIGDVDRALETGVDGVDIVIGTSSYLREFSHGKSIEEIKKMAKRVIQHIQAKDENIEIRFSTEDSFRSDIDDLMDIYSFVSELDISRVGIADTVGIAAPYAFYNFYNFVFCHFHFSGTTSSNWCLWSTAPSTVQSVTSRSISTTTRAVP